MNVHIENSCVLRSARIINNGLRDKYEGVRVWERRKRRRGEVGGKRRGEGEGRGEGGGGKGGGGGRGEGRGKEEKGRWGVQPEI